MSLDFDWENAPMTVLGLNQAVERENRRKSMKRAMLWLGYGLLGVDAVVALALASLWLGGKFS